MESEKMGSENGKLNMGDWKWEMRFGSEKLKKEKRKLKWEMQSGKIRHQETTKNIFNWSLTYSWCNIGPQRTDIQRSSEIKMIPHRVNTIRRENTYRKRQLPIRSDAG